MPPVESYDESLFPNAAEAEAASKLWGAGQEHAERGQPVGTFQMRINVAELGRSTSSNRLQIHYELEILVGEFKEVVVHKYDGLGSPEQAAITQSQLVRLGIDTKAMTISTLPAVLLTLKGKTIQASTKKNGEFYNIYFQKMLGELVGGDAGATTGGASTAGAKAGGKPAGKKKF